ncbi:Pre-mRNA-splicing factor srp2 [Erysiphe necator]|nr:Pre-mRNA-splicing factor srp2 [Erysiphe necator]
MMNEVSSTRLYLGNLPRNATKADVEAHFNSHGTGEITEIKLMNGFGFIEYKDALDARDVVPAFHGSDFMGERLTVQFARGSRSREAYANTERIAPRPRRTPHRMQISGLPGETSWQVCPYFPFFTLEFWISLSSIGIFRIKFGHLCCAS